MRIHDLKTTALIFALGKMVVICVKLEDNLRLVSRKYTRIIQKLGFDAEFSEFKTQKVAGSCNVKFPIRFGGLTFSSYKPEVCISARSTYNIFDVGSPRLFSSLICWHTVEQKVALLVFMYGEIFFAGTKVGVNFLNQDHAHRSFDTGAYFLFLVTAHFGNALIGRVSDH